MKHRAASRWPMKGQPTNRPRIKNNRGRSACAFSNQCMNVKGKGGHGGPYEILDPETVHHH
jgi:hypothetical protein